jgi:hypothetical protein
VTYDPYSEEGHYASLKYEDEIRLRASLVCDVHRKALLEIGKHVDKLSLTERERLN